MAMQQLWGYAPSTTGLGGGQSRTAQSDFDPWAAEGQRRLQQPQLDTQLEQARIAASAATHGADLQQQRFNTVFPWLQGQLAGGGGSQVGTQPHITVGGVYNPNQIQQQVNATRAQNDQAMQSRMRQQQQATSGMGYGANSPILAALQGQAFASNLGTNTQAEQRLRTTAAQQNAQQLLGTQTAAENQFASRQKEDIQRRNALLSILGGMI